MYTRRCEDCGARFSFIGVKGSMEMCENCTKEVHRDRRKEAEFRSKWANDMRDAL